MIQRVIFMGTPIFAAEILKTLIREKYDIVAVVSQPDKAIGRKQEVKYSPVKQVCITHGLPLLQPIKCRLAADEILAYQPDIIITCAYGQMIPDIILDTPMFGVINIHASLLPRLRGGAPIHHAIIQGETTTGITLMRSSSQMDAGDIIASSAIDITLEDTTATLHDKLIEVAKDLLVKQLPLILNNQVTYTPQDPLQVTFGMNIKPQDEIIDFNQPYLEVYNRIRGLISWPVGYAILDGMKVKFHGVTISELATDATNGTIVGFDDQALLVAVDGRILRITALQLEGKSKMDASVFYHGNGRNQIGKQFYVQK